MATMAAAASLGGAGGTGGTQADAANSGMYIPNGGGSSGGSGAAAGAVSGYVIQDMTNTANTQAQRVPGSSTMSDSGGSGIDADTWRGWTDDLAQTWLRSLLAARGGPAVEATLRERGGTHAIGNIITGEGVSFAAGAVQPSLQTRGFAAYVLGQLAQAMPTVHAQASRNSRIIAALNSLVRKAKKSKLQGVREGPCSTCSLCTLTHTLSPTLQVALTQLQLNCYVTMTCLLEDSEAVQAAVATQKSMLAQVRAPAPLHR